MVKEVLSEAEESPALEPGRAQGASVQELHIGKLYTKQVAAKHHFYEVYLDLLSKQSPAEFDSLSIQQRGTNSLQKLLSRNISVEDGVQ